MTNSFHMNGAWIKFKVWDFSSLDDDKVVGFFNSFLSHGESDLGNKLGSAYEEDSFDGQLTEDGGRFKVSQPWFMESFQIIFGRIIKSFGGRSKGSEFLVAKISTDDLSGESAMLFAGHIFVEAMVN
jgi:hypothetical protein